MFVLSNKLNNIQFYDHEKNSIKNQTMDLIYYEWPRDPFYVNG